MRAVQHLRLPKYVSVRLTVPVSGGLLGLSVFWGLVNQVPIPETTAVKYFRDVVKGLEYLHFNR